MSPCNKFFAMLFLSLTVITLLFVHSNADEALIRKVCSKADDVNYCLQLFQLDSRSKTLDEHGLALLAIQTAITKAQETLNEKISDLSNTITDPVGKQRLGTCKSDYTHAVAMYSSAFDSTDKKAYFDAIDWVRKGANDVIDCQDIYRRKDPIAESPISAENIEIAIKISAVILTVIDDLIRQ